MSEILKDDPSTELVEDPVKAQEMAYAEKPNRDKAITLEEELREHIANKPKDSVLGALMHPMQGSPKSRAEYKAWSDKKYYLEGEISKSKSQAEGQGEWKGRMYDHDLAINDPDTVMAGLPEKPPVSSHGLPEKPPVSSHVLARNEALGGEAITGYTATNEEADQLSVK